MEQRRALADAGSAAGILQEGDIVASDLRLVELNAAAGRERVGEGYGAGYRIGRDHLLQPPHHEVDDHALEAEQIAHAADDDVLHGGPPDDHLHRRWPTLSDPD